ncbi:transposase [Streptomyces goshikiensis]
MLSELGNRGIEDVCIVVCDGLKGLPGAVSATGRKPPSRPACSI